MKKENTTSCAGRPGRDRMFKLCGPKLPTKGGLYDLHESNKYNMYTTTSGVLDANKPKADNVPKLAAGAAKLGEGL